MQKLEPIFKFLNKPPEWFALLFWFYPIVWYLVVYALMASIGQAIPKIGYYLLVSFPLPILFLLFTSKWFRVRILLMLFCWIILPSIFLGLTQGAITSALAKIFSVVAAGPIEIQK
jgi:hypothetical protein